MMILLRNWVVVDSSLKCFFSLMVPPAVRNMLWKCWANLGITWQDRVKLFVSKWTSDHLWPWWLLSLLPYLLAIRPSSYIHCSTLSSLFSFFILPTHPLLVVWSYRGRGGPLVIHWLLHRSFAQSLGTHIIWLPALLPHTYYLCISLLGHNGNISTWNSLIAKPNASSGKMLNMRLSLALQRRSSGGI